MCERFTRQQLNRRLTFCALMACAFAAGLAYATESASSALDAAERAAMPVATQRMARAKAEVVARIEADAKTGRKTAVIIRADDTVERRPVRVLATARVRPAPPPKHEPPLDAGHAAAAAAGAAAALAAAKALKKGNPK